MLRAAVWQRLAVDGLAGDEVSAAVQLAEVDVVGAQPARAGPEC